MFESLLRLALYRVLFVLPVGFLAIFATLLIISTEKEKAILIDLFFFKHRSMELSSFGIFLLILIALVLGEKFSSLGEILLANLIFKFMFDKSEGFKERISLILNEKSLDLRTLKNELNKKTIASEISEVHYSLSRMWAGIYLVAKITLMILLLSKFELFALGWWLSLFLPFLPLLFICINEIRGREEKSAEGMKIVKRIAEFIIKFSFVTITAIALIVGLIIFFLNLKFFEASLRPYLLELAIGTVATSSVFLFYYHRTIANIFIYY